MKKWLTWPPKNHPTSSWSWPPRLVSRVPARAPMLVPRKAQGALWSGSDARSALHTHLRRVWGTRESFNDAFIFFNFLLSPYAPASSAIPCVLYLLKSAYSGWDAQSNCEWWTAQHTRLNGIQWLNWMIQIEFQLAKQQDDFFGLKFLKFWKFNLNVLN